MKSSLQFPALKNLNMNKSSACVIVATCLFAQCSLADEPMAGIYELTRPASGSASRAPAPSAVIRIGPIKNGKVRLSVRIEQPTVRQLCSGAIEGTARVAGNRLVLTRRDNDGVCRLEVEAAGGKASVVGESGCGGYHGVGCSFETSAVDLPRSLRSKPAGQRD